MVGQNRAQARRTGADLDRPVASIGDLDLDAVAAFVDDDALRPADDSAGLVGGQVGLLWVKREAVVGRRRQERAIERVGEVARVGADWLVDRDEKGAGGRANDQRTAGRGAQSAVESAGPSWRERPKDSPCRGAKGLVSLLARTGDYWSSRERTVRKGALDHDLVQGRHDAGHAVPPAEHVLAELHELGDRVLAVADELLELRCNQTRRLGLVELESSGEPLLGERADLGRVGETRSRVRSGRAAIRGWARPRTTSSPGGGRACLARAGGASSRADARGRRGGERAFRFARVVSRGSLPGGRARKEWTAAGQARRAQQPPRDQIVAPGSGSISRQAPCVLASLEALRQKIARWCKQRRDACRRSFRPVG